MQLCLVETEARKGQGARSEGGTWWGWPSIQAPVALLLSRLFWGTTFSRNSPPGAPLRNGRLSVRVPSPPRGTVTLSWRPPVLSSGPTTCRQFWVSIIFLLHPKWAGGPSPWRFTDFRDGFRVRK